MEGHTVLFRFPEEAVQLSSDAAGVPLLPEVEPRQPGAAGRGRTSAGDELERRLELSERDRAA